MLVSAELHSSGVTFFRDQRYEHFFFVLVRRGFLSLVKLTIFPWTCQCCHATSLQIGTCVFGDTMVSARFQASLSLVQREETELSEPCLWSFVQGCRTTSLS